MTYDSEDIDTIVAEELGHQPVLEASDNIKEEDTVSNIAERHW